jgi:hypothetical protein
MNALKLFIFLFFVLICSPTWVWAQGGPPMITDDPGTPGDKNWEINLAGIYSTGGGQQILQLPYLDINYGWGERIQLKIETGVGTAKVGSSSAIGVESLLLGVKYRFLDEERAGISISTYPQVQFHTFFISDDPVLTAPGNQFILPFEFLKTLGDFEVNLDLGYIDATEVSSDFFYGILLAYEKPKPWEPLLEVHVNTNTDGTGSMVLLNAGFRYALTDKTNFLFAIGHTLDQPADLSPELTTYIGFQLH